MFKRVRVAFSFLTPNTWAPLMVGIAASGVFADYILRPAVDSTVQSACSTVAHHQQRNGNVDLDREGVCKGFFKQESSNGCLNPERTTVQYSLVNSDLTVTKWVAGLDPSGHITGIKELQLDPEQKNVLKAPVEYRLSNEDLIEVRTSPTESLKPDILNKFKTGAWARYALIASIMRTAASSCQPGKYDELLRSAQKVSEEPQAYFGLQSAHQLRNRKNINEIRNLSL